MQGISGVSTQVIKDALVKAGEAFSELVERRLQPADVSVSYHDPMDLPSVWQDASAPVCAAFYQVVGDLPGYLLLIFPGSQGDDLARVLLGPEHCDEAMVESALGEVGNIVGSSFLNHVADHFRIAAAPTPPQVIRDMVGALLETLAAISAAEGKERIPVIRTAFIQNGEAINVFLLWVADAEAMFCLGESR